jgi:hypothetical protein
LTEKGGKYLNAPWGRMKEVRRPIYQPSSIIGLVTSYIGELPIQPLSYLFLTQPQQNLKEFSAHKLFHAYKNKETDFQINSKKS